MIPKLTSEMRSALSETSGEPIQVEDDLTQLKYVLLPLPLFQRLQSFFTDAEFDVTDAYAAQSAVAGAAGWDDPEMNVYDGYDAHRPAEIGAIETSQSLADLPPIQT